MTTVIMKQDVSQLTQGDIAFFRLDEPTRTFARYGIEKEQAFGEHEKRSFFHNIVYRPCHKASGIAPYPTVFQQ